MVKKNPSQEEILTNGTMCVIDVWEEILEFEMECSEEACKASENGY